MGWMDLRGKRRTRGRVEREREEKQVTEAASVSVVSGATLENVSILHVTVKIHLHKCFKYIHNKA
jgi:hypothetical protein